MLAHKAKYLGIVLVVCTVRMVPTAVYLSNLLDAPSVLSPPVEISVSRVPWSSTDDQEIICRRRRAGVVL